MAILDRLAREAPDSLLFNHDAGELSDALDLAMRLGQVEIRFQPQFCSKSGRILGAEALTRWLHPVYGEIGATELFAIAASAGLAEKLSRHVLLRAIDLAKDWPGDLGLSLNTSPRQLLGEGFVGRLLDALAAAPLDPARVTIEITEELLLNDLDLASRNLGRLRDAGLRIALDDFGAGFCNFDYIKRLPLSALKLDRSMISGIAENERDLAILRAIVTMARVLGLEVIAEGVETEGQRTAVIAEGCAAWQGFLGAGPLAREQLLRMAAGR